MAYWLIKNPIDILSGAADGRGRPGPMDIRIRAGVITEMAPDLAPRDDEEVVDASRCVVYPGWVNTHHHLFQSGLKAVSAGIDKRLFDWISLVPQPRVNRFTREMLEITARVGLAELALSGTTTCADHHYVYHRHGDPEMADVLFDVADELGMRFALCRGGATKSRGPIDASNQPEPETLEQFIGDIERLRAKYHQDSAGAMRRILVAPSTPTFSVEPEELRELAAEARRMGLRMHSHLSETEGYVEYCREHHGLTPVDFVGEHDWLGDDVYFAHMVHAAPEEWPALARTRTGIAHCPQSNARLASGIAPAPAMARAGVPISMGVDGAASNEAADMISETHMAWLVHRTGMDATATSVEDVVHWATRGGAEVLGLDRIGTLEVGREADLVLYDLDAPRYCGMHDPGIAPVACGGTPQIRLSMAQGRPVVIDGQLPNIDMRELAERAQRVVRELI